MSENDKTNSNKDGGDYVKQEDAYKDYCNGMKYQEIADKYGVTINTVKSWKQRNGWHKKGAHKAESMHTKTGAPYGNKNAEGHGS
jgi:Uncharacterized conserved protein